MSTPRRWNLKGGETDAGTRYNTVDGPFLDPWGPRVEVIEAAPVEAELERLRAGNVAVCEDTGMIARDGVCPAHEGDACLVIPGAYVGQLRELRARFVRTEAESERLRAENERLREGLSLIAAGHQHAPSIALVTLRPVFLASQGAANTAKLEEGIS